MTWLFALPSLTTLVYLKQEQRTVLRVLNGSCQSLALCFTLLIVSVFSFGAAVLVTMIVMRDNMKKLMLDRVPMRPSSKDEDSEVDSRLPLLLLVGTLVALSGNWTLVLVVSATAFALDVVTRDLLPWCWEKLNLNVEFSEPLADAAMAQGHADIWSTQPEDLFSYPDAQGPQCIPDEVYCRHHQIPDEICCGQQIPEEICCSKQMIPDEICWGEMTSEDANDSESTEEPSWCCPNTLRCCPDCNEEF